jgi:hypothetical protein
MQMLPNLRTLSTAAIAALALAATAAAPVQAGQRERDFLKGVAATVIVGTVLQNMNKQRAQAQTPRGYYQQPAYQQPQYYVPPSRNQQTNFVPQAHHGLTTSAAAQAFKSYSPTERRAIQRQLSRQGYYYGAIDGVFGPATYRALSSYAVDRGLSGRIDSASGAYTVYDSLIY